MSAQAEATQRVEIRGFVAPGFEPVREAFARSFAERGELGAAFAAMRDGESVVDLWGGLADRASGRPWSEDAIVLVYSGSKGFLAACMLLLIERGQLELDAAVADYWPEFAQAGKAHVRVRDVVAHTVRLPFLETPVTWQEATDGVRMAELLATQAQNPDPRAAYSYHPLTFGWLCGELVRRIDGRSIGRFFAEELAEPLELDLWIGLPEEHEPRVATLEPGLGYGVPPGDPDDTYMQKLWGNPQKGPLAGMPENERAWQAAEIPGFSYAMNRQDADARALTRCSALLDALHRCATETEAGR